MRVGVVGLGSMGTRRVRDLLALGHEVKGFDVREDRNRRALVRFGIHTATSMQALLDEHLDAIVISTPPDQHAGCYSAAFEASVPFFGEASILTPLPEWFDSRMQLSGVRGYPSATWRFYAPLNELAKRLKAGATAGNLSIQHEYADYLPRWHPWENYWDFYAGARQQTSAAREMVPFEFEWLCWIFGNVSSVCAVVARLGSWRTDIDDSYFLQVRFVNGLHATVRIELHRQCASRKALIAGISESYELDFNADKLRRYDHERAAWANVEVEQSSAASVEFEGVYAAEIRAFMDAVSGLGTYPKSWVEDRHLSDVLVAAERSAKERRWVDINEIAQGYEGIALDV